MKPQEPRADALWKSPADSGRQVAILSRVR